jgi:hypothetical protein
MIDESQQATLARDEPVHIDDIRHEGGDGRAAAPARSRWRQFLASSVARSTWPAWAAFLLTSIVFCLHIAAYAPLSPVDEIQHVDYVYHLMHGHLLHAGQQFSPDALHTLSCRGIDTAPPIPAPCGGPYDVNAMPGGGFDTAFTHSPLYYTVPAAAGLLGKALGIGGDLVDVLRLTSVLWWALFVAVAWRLFRELDVNRWAGAAGILLTAATPVILQTHSIVNNDATALPAGAAITLAALLWDRDALRLRWLVLLAAVAVALKATNVVVVVAVAVFLLVRYWQRHGWNVRESRPAARRTAIAVGALALASVIVGIAWQLASAHLQLIDPALIPGTKAFYVPSFRPVWLFGSTDAFLSPILPEFIDSVMASQSAQVLGVLTNYGLMGMAILGAVLAAPGSRVRALAGGTAVAAAVMPSVFVLINYTSTHTSSLITSRYGLSLVPAMLVVGLTSVRSRSGRTAIVVIGLGALLAMGRVLLV